MIRKLVLDKIKMEFLNLVSPAGSSKRFRVGVILARNFTLSAFSLFIDHLRLAADDGDRSRPLKAQWSIMASSIQPIRASCGVLVEPTSAFLKPTTLDYIVVVGGVLHAGRQIDPATVQYLRAAATAHVPLIGICTGSFILCRAGLMSGRRACVSWYHYQDFREQFPDHGVVADRLFLEDGPRITCAGGAGVAALATFLIERHLGPAAAQKSSHVMLFDRSRSGSDSQPHPPLSQKVEEPRVRRALLLMEQNVTRPVPITSIARELGMSVRQLERICRAHVGAGPTALYRSLRMRYAQWLIKCTNLPITEIAADAGFADCAHFSREYRRAFGIAPSTTRAQPASGAAGAATRTRVFK
jgi:transcriptional regulator GlxA family with amidase domain